MKTSLIIDDNVFKEAKKEAAHSGKTISEIISQWVIAGKDLWIRHKQKKVKKFKPVALGLPLVNLSNRKNWTAELNDGLDRNLDLK